MRKTDLQYFVVFGLSLMLPLAACKAENKAENKEHQAGEWAGKRAELLSVLKRGGIKDAAILKAMSRVPRHRFVPESMRSRAYFDRPLPIGLKQTISQPWIVAYMSASLRIQAGQKVLEVGTGSGYQAAVLAEMGAHVYSVEILPELGQRARALLRRLGYDKVWVRVADGYDGWPAHAPYDAVIVTAAPLSVPEALVKQLKEGGRMSIPMGPAHDQQLITFLKRKGKLVELKRVPVRFVPMTGKVQA